MSRVYMKSDNNDISLNLIDFQNVGGDTTPHGGRRRKVWVLRLYLWNFHIYHAYALVICLCDDQKHSGQC